MIQFSLKCDQDHQFESWFGSAGDFDKLQKAGMISCAVCGSAGVKKALMAPRVTAARAKAIPKTEPDAKPTKGALSKPATPAEQALAEIKRNVEENSEYVGMSFAQEARAMHDGDAPERAIYGEAKPDEARKLIEDGVPVAPLPFIPGNKTN